MKQEYSEICGFIRAWMSVVIVRSNILLLQGTRDKEAHIYHRLDLENEVVMALLEPWRV